MVLRCAASARIKWRSGAFDQEQMGRALDAQEGTPVELCPPANPDARWSQGRIPPVAAKTGTINATFRRLGASRVKKDYSLKLGLAGSDP